MEMVLGSYMSYFGPPCDKSGYSSMKLKRIVKIRVNLSRVTFCER